METFLKMSNTELNRLNVIQKVAEKRLRQKEAGALLQLSTRQIKRLLKNYQAHKAAGLVSKRRGRPSNHQLSAEVKQQALALLQSQYQGFGPTLACEKLQEREHLLISVESVRQLMIAEGLWKPHKLKKIVAHQLRERRACFGELVQIDGSPHDWFEGRVAACVLLVFIDDATGQLLQLRFADNESFFSYSQAAADYFQRQGKPVALYSDKHGVFRVNQTSVGAGEALTQFGRAMQDLDIQIICANTPQAKGRVERVIQTLQDRLPKEMRLRQISSREAGQAYLPEFRADFNQRFAEPARSTLDAHRPLSPHDNLAQILTWQETRTLSKNLTLQFEKVVYQIQTPRPTYALRQARVTVCLTADQQVTILYKGQPLAFTVFQPQTQQAKVVAAKDLNQTLDSTAKPKPYKPAPDHPWRSFVLSKNSQAAATTPSNRMDTPD